MAELIRLQGTGGALWRVAGVTLLMDGTVAPGTAAPPTSPCRRTAPTRP
ncbi:hypothetical protein ACWC2T_20325 [Streptomyces sp. NPDC001393]